MPETRYHLVFLSTIEVLALSTIGAIHWDLEEDKEPSLEEKLRTNTSTSTQGALFLYYGYITHIDSLIFSYIVC